MTKKIGIHTLYFAELVMKQKIAMAEQSFLMLFHRMHDTMTLFREGNGRMTIHTMCFWRTWRQLGAKGLLPQHHCICMSKHIQADLRKE